MPKAYSLDLRQRVARVVEGGRSCHAAAAHFSVSVSFVVRLMKSLRATGRLAPKPSGGRRHAKLDPHRAFLLARIAEKADLMVWTAPAPASRSIESCAKMVVVEQPSEGAPSMGKSITDLSSVTTVVLELAKHVFQVHGIDASGRVIVAKALRRKDVLSF